MSILIDDDPKLERFVDMREVSFRLSCQRTTIYELFKAKELTPIKLLPKKTVVLERELQEYIERKFEEARQLVSA